MAKKDVKRNTKKRKTTRMQIIIRLFFVILAVVALLVGAILYLRYRKTPVADPSSNNMCVQSITVIGNTHYDDNAIIGESGLAVGQNLLTVNKTGAARKIEKVFAYVDTATVKSPSFNTLEIHIVETKPLGAMYAQNQWLIVGANGKILETMPVESDRPGRYFYLQGAKPAADVSIGAAAMDTRSLRIANTLFTAIEKYKLDGIMAMDMRDKTNISLNYRNTVTILLGNESNLDAEISLLTKTLPQIIEKNGGSIEGRIDMSSYSDTNDANDKIIYTPTDALPTKPTSAASSTSATSATAVNTTA